MPRDILIKFGKKIRELREKMELSQEALAARAGVHRTYIGMIERAEKSISLLVDFRTFLKNSLLMSLSEDMTKVYEGKRKAHEFRVFPFRKSKCAKVHC